MKLSPAANEILYRGLDDWVLFVEVIFAVERLLKEKSLSSLDLRERCIRLIAEVFDNGLMEVGDVVDGRGFVAWPTATSKEYAEVITRRWDALGREPDLGDICWLNLTEKGKLYAETLPVPESLRRG